MVLAITRFRGTSSCIGIVVEGLHMIRMGFGGKEHHRYWCIRILTKHQVGSHSGTGIAAWIGGIPPGIV